MTEEQYMNIGVYVKDKDLNTVYYEDINICESLTNKLLFDKESRLCFFGLR